MDEINHDELKSNDVRQASVRVSMQAPAHNNETFRVISKVGELLFHLCCSPVLVPIDPHRGSTSAPAVGGGELSCCSTLSDVEDATLVS